MPDRLQEIRARLDAATPGPWRLQICACEDSPCDDRSAVKAGGELVCDCANDPDAVLIQNAPSDLEYLLGEVEFLRRAGEIACARYEELLKEALDD